MIDGNAHDFIDKLYYEDHYVTFRGDKYYVNGCQTKKDASGNVISVKLEVYNLSKDTTIYSVIRSSAFECISDFEEALIWDGKKFWDAEKDMEWIDY